MTEAKAAKKPNPALMKPLQPSEELAAVVGVPAAPHRGGEQGVGLHQGQQPAEPGEQARDPGR